MKKQKNSIVIIFSLLCLIVLLIGCQKGNEVDTTLDNNTKEVINDEGTSDLDADASVLNTSEEDISEQSETSVKKLENVSAVDENGSYSCLYDGIERKFILYIPDDKSENAPLLFMLHGYSDMVESFITKTNMNDTALSKGYAVVYPQGISDPGDSTSGASWNSGLKSTGNDDTGFLVALARYLQDTYHFRSDATFAAGFSNGGFMMYRLATQAPDTFRAVASVSGFMTEGAWNERKDTASISILQINGTEDDVIPTDEKVAKGFTNPAPTIETAIQYWKDANGLKDKKEEKLSDKATAFCYSDSSTSNLVEHIVIDGGHHSWPDEQFAGFDTNKTIIEFFNKVINN